MQYDCQLLNSIDNFHFLNIENGCFPRFILAIFDMISKTPH